MTTYIPTDFANLPALDETEYLSDQEISEMLDREQREANTKFGGAKDFTEALHPRDRQGQFTETGGGLPADAEFEWSPMDAGIGRPAYTDLQMIVPIEHTRGMLDRARGRLELTDTSGDRSKFKVEYIYVTRSHRHEGIAEQLALEFHHKYPHATLVHGNYASKEGENWADHMVRTYPEWNVYDPVFGHTYVSGA